MKNGGEKNNGGNGWRNNQGAVSKHISVKRAKMAKWRGGGGVNQSGVACAAWRMACGGVANSAWRGGAAKISKAIKAYQRNNKMALIACSKALWRSAWRIMLSMAASNHLGGVAWRNGRSGIGVKEGAGGGNAAWRNNNVGNNNNNKMRKNDGVAERGMALWRNMAPAK